MRIHVVRKMPEAQFEVRENTETHQFHFNLMAPNGKIIATSETYKDKQGCLDGIASVKLNAPRARIVDFTETPPRIL
jgi:hypothetical protein